MTEHFNSDQLNSYLHRTLADAEREVLDRHLAECTTCRARLNGHEMLQQRIHNELFTELRSVQPSSGMSYAAIAPRLKHSRRIKMVLKQSNQFIYGALTMALLVVVGVGLYFFVNNLSKPTPTAPEEVEQLTMPTVVGEPEIKPTAEVVQPEVNQSPVELTSTGAMFRGNPQHTGVFDTPGPERGELKWKFKTQGIGWVSPAIVNRVVYFGGGRDNHLYALDSETGREKWKFKTGGTVETPVVAGGVIYLPSWDKYLYAVDSETGQEKWKFQTGGLAWAAPPTVANGLLYFGSRDGYFYALDSQTGQEKWRFETDNCVFSSPAVADGLVYVGGGAFEECGPADSRYVYALDSATGQEKWRIEMINAANVDSSPAVAEGIVYFGSHDGYLYAVDGQTGQEIWKFKTQGPIWSSPAVAAGIVYVGSRDTYLYAVDSQTGQEKWKFKADAVANDPVVAGGMVYFGSDDNYLYAVDSQTGQEKWKFRTDTDIIASPTVADGVIYFGIGDAYLYAVR